MKISTLISLTIFILSSAYLQADWDVPTNLEFDLSNLKEIPRVSPTGEVPEKLGWLIHTDDGSHIPSEILGKSFVLLAVKPCQFRVFVWNSDSPKETRQCVVSFKGGGLPEPVNPPGVEGPYQDLIKAVTEGIISAEVDSSIKRQDATTLYFYYGLMAERIARDGEKAEPAIKTIVEANAIVKAAEKEFLGGTSLSPLGGTYPLVSKAAADKFRSLFSATDDSLTPEKRRIYVDFLKCMSLGAAGTAFSDN